MTKNAWKDWSEMIEVHCDKTTIELLNGRFEYCNWVKEDAFWDEENQRGVVQLRILTIDDL